MNLKLAAVTFDCDDAAALAGFWSDLLGVPVDSGANAEMASIGQEHSTKGPAIFFLQVPDKTPGKNAVHLDLAAKDWTAQIDRAVDLGAKRMGDFDEAGFVWTTLADPEGNLFDIARG
ncbi:VOC family protein [Nocardioides speluncae]|uniref:VOC family protein n=1 Tax=Nocardioides speluncae TaxID=2670337 RepID=UPI000D68D83B|nr:VOC family protein [Nocardioides speluncae]